LRSSGALDPCCDRIGRRTVVIVTVTVFRGSDSVAKMEAAAGFEPAHNGFAVRSLNHLGTPPYRGRTHTYTTPLAGESAVEASCGGHALFFDTAYNAALLRAKILDVDVNFHTLRHTFASHYVHAWRPAGEAAGHLGHASIPTTQVYAHLAPDYLSGATAILVVKKRCLPSSLAILNVGSFASSSHASAMRNDRAQQRALAVHGRRRSQCPALRFARQPRHAILRNPTRDDRRQRQHWPRFDGLVVGLDQHGAPAPHGKMFS